MKYLLSLIIVVALVSCASVPPKAYVFDKTKNINKSYDDTWTKILQYFAVNNIPVKNIEKSSGFITSDLNVNMREQFPISDCGTEGFGSYYHNPSGNFTVLVEKIDDKQTKVTISAFFKIEVTDDPSESKVKSKYVKDCNSTGVFEGRIFEFISK